MRYDNRMAQSNRCSVNKLNQNRVGLNDSASFDENRKQLEKMKLIAQLDSTKECNKKECIDCAKCIMPDKRGDRYRYPQRMRSSY